MRRFLDSARRQSVETIDGVEYFTSYDSVIVKKDAGGQVFLDEKYWDYSKTTGKYRNQYLGEKKAATLAKIKAGIYHLVNLKALTTSSKWVLY